jgi:hypothetical protein
MDRALRHHDPSLLRAPNRGTRQRWVTSVLLSPACLLQFNIVLTFLQLSGGQSSSRTKSGKKSWNKGRAETLTPCHLPSAFPGTSQCVKLLKSIMKWIRAEGRKRDWDPAELLLP